MIIVTTDFVPGREIGEALGIVRGSTIRAKHIGKDIVAGLSLIDFSAAKEADGEALGAKKLQFSILSLIGWTTALAAVLSTALMTHLIPGTRSPCARCRRPACG